ncbi:taurine dioxygenase [Novosphingobium lindaniclasticum]|uniref:taurine dioxygenase n=1 Tax=Novosphingobium lindaniclasticum TaxID=1329895 RepID=UPI0009DC42AE|nr:taurine dioxygenase [Novosphingobium lindaniclasticum]
MHLTLKKISPALGAVVAGIDLARPLTEQLRLELLNSLVERQVLFFRDQHLTPQQHRDFAAKFGDLHIHPIYPHVAGVREIIVLDTQKIDLADNAIWHTDVTFAEKPPMGAILRAEKLPETGGDTLWSSGAAAYAALSHPMREMLEKLTATHDFVKSFPVERFGGGADAYAKWEKARLDNPPVRHPVIRSHPITGDKSIFVNEGFTSCINELSGRESKFLLEFLFQHIAKPEFTIRWQWQVGDIAFWDNRSTQHYAVDDYRPNHRVMHRATIIGDVPRA